MQSINIYRIKAYTNLSNTSSYDDEGLNSSAIKVVFKTVKVAYAVKKASGLAVDIYHASVANHHIYKTLKRAFG